MTVLPPTVTLAPGYTIPPIIKGGWQLADGHGAAVTEAQAIADMTAFAEAGITAFDCADIYTGVEARIGAFLRTWRARAGVPPIRVHTKCVPDRDRLATLTRADLERTVDRSRARLGVETLDLVQFHWWDYSAPRYVEAAQHLAAMQRDGRIAHLGVTNFDVPRLRDLLDAGVPIVSHQLQYSLLDRRPTHGMAAFCAERGIGLLCYGALAGGFLHERWHGVAAPRHLENRSLVKYRLIIEEFGGWDAFQGLLDVMARVAARHEATIGAVAVRWVLDQPGVSAAIVGARHAGHLPATLAAAALRLSPADHADLAAAVAEAPGPSGDCYTLEREPHGRHAAIMKYNLNESAPSP